METNETKQAETNETKAITTTTRRSPLNIMAERFTIEPAKMLEVLRGTVIKPTRDGKQATNEEVAAFVMVANQYGLNPFTREIHAFSSGDKGVVPIVGIDGWARIVNSQPDYNGCEFEITDEAVTCHMHIKGREHPVSVTEYMAECKRNTIPWNTMPRRMLRHKAFMQCARYAFGISGIHDEDEARDIVNNARDVTAEAEVAMPQRKRKAAPAQVAEPVVETAPNSEPHVDQSIPVAEQIQQRDDMVSEIERFETKRGGKMAIICHNLAIPVDEWKSCDESGLKALLAAIRKA